MPTLLNQLIDEAALRDPTGVAIRHNGDSLSYEDLARSANGLARVLLETGLERRDRVAVLLGKSPKVPISFHGVFASGGILVPIDPKSPVEQIIQILRATGATRLVTEPGKRVVVQQVLAACPEVTHVIGQGSIKSPTAENPTTGPVEFIPWTTAVEDEASDLPPAVRVIELDPAYVLHTSGSTGVPKLIQHTHRGAMSFVNWAVAEYSLTSNDRLSNHSSHHTCFATFDYYAAAGAGATTVLLPPAVMMMPASLSALLARERVSVWYSVPTALVQLSLRGDLEARDLSALRWVMFAGETFPEKYLRQIMGQLPDARFSHVYGSTETNVCTYHHLPDHHALSSEPGGPLPIGKACSNSSTLVVDGELQAVLDGEIGELLVRGSTLMSGYWGEPEKNRCALVRRPLAGGLEEVYYRTGDRVRVRRDGNLTFVARADRQVKVRGFRVELEEIETALLSLDPVEEAAAFVVPDGEGSSAIQASIVIGGKDRDLSIKNEILDHLKKILPVHSMPAEITLLDSLPRTPTGKTDRNALRTSLTA